MEDTKTNSIIILQHKSYRENDSLVIVYSLEKGKKILIAKGTRSPKSKLLGHLEPLSFIRAMIIKGRGYDYVASILSLDAFLNIKKDINSLYYVGEFISIFIKLLAEEEEDKLIFNLLLTYLKIVDGLKDASQKDLELISSLALFKLAEYLGYTPNFETCSNCGEKIKKDHNYFDFQSGSLIDTQCYHYSPHLQAVSNNVIKLCRVMIASDILMWNKLKVDDQISREALELIKRFLSYQF